MKLLIKESEFIDAKSRDLIPYICDGCAKTHYRKKHEIQANVKKNGKLCKIYCSKICYGASNVRVRETKYCKQCNKPIYLRLKEIQKHERVKSKNYFCSKRCRGIHTSQNRIKGDKRSKLEYWIEDNLTKIFPGLHILYNNRQKIGAELDIYLPHLSLAFELNGIFHYEPIFGKEKLQQIENRDRNKLHLCTKAKIDLCVIDTSSVRYFKPKTSEKFLNIIIKIIQDRLNMMNHPGNAPGSAG